MVTFTPSRVRLDIPSPAILIMASDPFFRCPGCGSLLTSETALPGLWECGYCFCLFPVDLEKDGMDIIAC
jgi:hypothetical protein